MATITITPGNSFTATETVTSTKLNDLGSPTAALDAGTIVNADVSATADISGSKLADATVTKAKIENVADYKVLGNVSGTAAAPQEVAILDEDDMVSNSDTALATQQSIKAYVDSSAQTFVPASYVGGESVTLPNGLIMKTGSVTTTRIGTSITFETPFPNGVVSALACPNSAEDLTQGTGYSGKAAVDSLTTSGMNVSCNGNAYWQAIGY